MLVGLDIPNFDYLVGSKGDQVIFLFVDGQILHTGIVTIKVGKSAKRERIPHNNVPFLTAGSNKPMSGAVNERVDTFLVEVEGLSLVRQVVDVVDVDETVQRATHYVHQIGVVFDFGDPALMNPLF